MTTLESDVRWFASRGFDVRGLDGITHETFFLGFDPNEVNRLVEDDGLRVAYDVFVGFVVTARGKFFQSDIGRPVPKMYVKAICGFMGKGVEEGIGLEVSKYVIGDF